MNDKISTLKFLNEFYEKNKKGCISLETSTDPDIITELFLEGFIFKTKEGYFISTYGQEYLLNNS